jgi:hypothetical protein
MKANKNAKGGVQGTLDAVLEKTLEVKAYMHEGVTHAIVQFVVCDDQVGVVVVLCKDTDFPRLGTCCCGKTCISQLSCCNETQNNV